MLTQLLRAIAHAHAGPGLQRCPPCRPLAMQESALRKILDINILSAGGRCLLAEC